MRQFIFLTVLLLFIPLVYPMDGMMPLLAVKQTDNGYEGSTAELFLEINEGTGRVFVDTFPLSKIDTQISMRFAKEIACDFLEYDCDDYDFIYTIRAGSPIIGGPSAGAAATILTITVLSDIELKEDVSITGTINSGGLIGPVGGLKEKIEAGAKNGLKKILIPEGDRIKINRSDNESINITEFGKENDIEIIEVLNLISALEVFTEQDFDSSDEEISISQNYKNTMRGLAASLCKRNSDLKEMVITKDISQDVIEIYGSAMNLSIKGEIASNQEEFYAAASFCFGSNVKFNQVFLEMKNFSDSKYEGLLVELRKEIESFEKKMDNKKIKTITDLESYMVVKERLREGMMYANLTKNLSYSYIYAYANERLRSAYSWAEFFKNQGKILELDEDSLRESCRQRIAEAEERLQYAAIYLPFEIESARSDLDAAYDDFNNGDFELCLFKASKSKAESNIVLNTLGIERDYVSKLIDNKLNAATKVIVKAEKKGMFPILGYSYYEYANNLRDDDEFSALLYAEYALELSNLDIYFKERKMTKIWKVENSMIYILVMGVLIGFIMGFIVKKKPNKKAKKKR